MKNPILKLSIVIAVIAAILAGVYFFDGGGLLTGSLREVELVEVEFDEEASLDQALFSETQVLKAEVEGGNVTYNFRSPLNLDVMDKYAFLVLDEQSEIAIDEEIFFRLIASDNEGIEEINKEEGLKSALYTFEKSERKGTVSAEDLKKSIGYSPSESVNVVLIPFMYKNGAFLIGSRGDNIALELK